MPKLPADLPENWTRGQIVSPNGIETGLTEKHGYNYLMKQVNNTQTEVNNINTALTDVAQQATVDKINNKIGTEADADTQPTLFGRLAQVKKVLLEKLAELLTKVTGIDGKIGDIGDPAGEESLVGLIKNIPKTVPTGAIKSVQSGHITAIKTGGVADVTINTVKPEKCICTVIGGYQSSNLRPAVIKELSSTKLKIITLGMTGESSNNVAIYWEVAEFY